MTRYALRGLVDDLLRLAQPQPAFLREHPNRLAPEPGQDALFVKRHGA